MTTGVLSVSVALFLVSAILEGGITLTVVQALERLRPHTIRTPEGTRSLLPVAIGLTAVLLASFGVLLASTAPDGIERLGEQTGISVRVRALLHTPLSSYHLAFVQSDILSKAAAGLAGVFLIYGVCLLLGRVVARNRSV
jgi:hypothetical protein